MNIFHPSLKSLLFDNVDMNTMVLKFLEQTSKKFYLPLIYGKGYKDCNLRG